MSAETKRGPLRVGIDVGGTFTKAVAVEPTSLGLVAQAVVPTTHRASAGVSEGAADALRRLVAALGSERTRIELVAFSTTQAMNALLEGDVARVGVVGIGAAPNVRVARRRTRIGEVKLAPGRSLRTEHEFLDATRGLRDRDVDAALERLARAGCEAVAASGAFSVDAPDHESLVIERALSLGLPACAGHELTGVYGLETRTVSAAVNASILPVVARTAGLVEGALADAGLRVPLLVLRGDAGAMSVEAFRRRPSFTVGSGPAAGVAAALHQLALRDGIVVECGGTSSNVSVVRRGRPALRSLRVMGRPTCIRSVDSWVVAAGGGSMARIGRRRIAEAGPRSAHISALPYASFARPDDLAGAELELVAPLPGDPVDYAVVRAGGRLYAVTATCAANALGLVPPEAYPAGSREAALLAFAALARSLRSDADETAQALLERAVAKIADVVAAAAREHDLERDVPLVALGGAGEALVPEVARRLGRPVVRPHHPEVLSSIGTALSLVRAEALRTASGETLALAVAREAERACVEAGAAPGTVTVETSYEPRERVLRAVATGAVALETGSAARSPADQEERLSCAADALGIGQEALSLVARNDFYYVFSENGSGRVAVVDRLGSVPLAENAHRVLAGEGVEFLDELRAEVAAKALHLGVATISPRVSLIFGPRILDLSDARRPDDIMGAAERALAGHDGPAVAVVAR
ncbi:MAG: hydantoinase/oxoprolinase family protein [Actinomycetota bacterium]|nr:hydantoinase/oxoprolinase family protein [Actinomycetota bacterium]